MYDRDFAVWGDHSSLLSKGFLVYTVNVIYSKTIFFTDDEVFQISGKNVNVQSLVEQPFIYIFAQCSDSIAEKLSYVSLRREDILEMSLPLAVNHVLLKDKIRFFKGKHFPPVTKIYLPLFFLIITNKNNLYLDIDQIYLKEIK